MRYTAVLQRFDDAHVEVATSDSRDECVAAATAVYTALIPSIYSLGVQEVKEDIASARAMHGDGSPEHREAASAAKHGNGISAYLRAREWGVGVYDTEADEPGATTAPTPKSAVPILTFWVGATREDPKL